MDNDQFGTSLFSQSEIDEAFNGDKKRKEKAENGFFKDGQVRKVVVNRIDREEKISKKGNPYVLHTFFFTDVDTQETEKHVDYGFKMSNAFDSIKKELGLNFRAGVTVLNLLTTKTGEREYLGLNYPEYAWEVSVHSNPDPKPTTSTTQSPF